jgi:hypothetical protein
VNDRDLLQLQATYDFAVIRLFVLLTPLATPALTRESHDGLPDPACLTGFGPNHRCVQRSSANLHWYL